MYKLIHTYVFYDNVRITLKFFVRTSTLEAERCLLGLVLFSLVWFYGISTIVGYPNPFLYIETVQFQTILFSISRQFNSI